MHSLEPEIRELQSATLIDEAAAAQAIALDSGTTFTLFQELRAALYLAVAMITTGVGLWLKVHLDRIGPITIVGALGIAAAGCYGRACYLALQGRARSLGGDYLLLLGALLFSAALGYAESQFHWLGKYASLHWLFLAIWHAATAYWLNSRLVLAVSLSSLATWFGIETALGPVMGWSRLPVEIGGRALTCAALVFFWRLLNMRAERRPQFQTVFEHFATNLAFLGALAWSYSTQRSWLGLVVTIGLAALVLVRGRRMREEIFIVYGVCYAAVATGVVLSHVIHDALLNASVLLFIVVTAALTLWHFHRQLQRVAG